MHPEQNHFCLSVKEKFPEKFRDVYVLDIGSLDINGSNHFLFEDYTYIGVDVGAGRNVDVVCNGHEYTLPTPVPFDVVISTECFEHDMHWRLTLQNCVRLLKPGGLFLFTCATTGRQEHGTTRTTPQDSPFTHTLFNDYYMNLTEEDIRSALDMSIFTTYSFSTNDKTKDLYFYGLTKP